MAKKTPRSRSSRKSTRRKTRGSTGPFILRQTNFKFIGVAFERAIEDLKMIRPRATDKAAVTDAIDRLEALEAKTAQICPQNWFIDFDVV